ncbi:MAG: DinB family protein [Ferruginibacter sp.]|nr:DinB family protein [Ferruginibacter sp.]
MSKQLEILLQTRRNLLSLIDDLTIDQLNEIPAGFNNNIVWNLGHMIASQQGVCYLRAGLPLVVEEKYFESFKPGTRPSASINSDELDTLKALLLSTIDQLKADYENDLFKNYIPWTTRYNVPLSNIDETINFLTFHDGLHVGYIMALKHLVKQLNSASI